MTIGDLFARYANSGRPGAGAGDAAPALAQVSLVLQSTMAMVSDAYEQMRPAVDAVSTGIDAIIDASGVADNRMAGWLEAAKRYDVEAGDVANAINAMRLAYGQSGAAGGQQNAWRLLGIAPQADPFDTLDQISGRIKGLDQDDARSLLAGIGIGENLLRLFQQQGLSVGNGLGENADASATYAFRSLASLDIVNSLLGVAGNALNEIAAVAGNVLNAQQGILTHDKNANSQTLAVGDLNAWSLDGKTASGGELGALIDAITEPTRQLLTLFGNAYETPGGEVSGIGSVLEDVKGAFGQWGTIDPETYAFSMAEFLKAQALPAGSVPVVTQATTAPVTNVNVSQHIESGGDPLDMARQITREIEAAGRQYPRASY